VLHELLSGCASIMTQFVGLMGPDSPEDYIAELGGLYTMKQSKVGWLRLGQGVMGRHTYMVPVRHVITASAFSSTSVTSDAHDVSEHCGPLLGHVVYTAGMEVERLVPGYTHSHPQHPCHSSPPTHRSLMLTATPAPPCSSMQT
jgi:hypothetical protein